MPATSKEWCARILRCGYGATGDGNSPGIRPIRKIGLKSTRRRSNDPETTARLKELFMFISFSLAFPFFKTLAQPVPVVVNVYLLSDENSSLCIK